MLLSSCPTQPLAVALLACLDIVAAVPHVLTSRQDQTLSQQSTCNDLYNAGLTSDKWNTIDAGDYFSGWWAPRFGHQDWAHEFGDDFGVGAKMRCDLGDDCQAIDCNDMNNDGNDGGDGPAYAILTSAFNLYSYLSKVKSAVDVSAISFGMLENSLQQTFWPSDPPDTTGMDQFLSALSAVFGMALAPAGTAGGVASAMIGGVIAAGSAAYDAAQGDDESAAHLADLESAAASWYTSVSKTLTDLTDGLFGQGHYDFGDGNVADVQPLFADGAWLDYNSIPVLATDGSKPQLNEFQLEQLLTNILFGQVINFAWRQQATYVVKYDMSQEDFDNFVSPSGSNDFRLKTYYGGSAFFFQSLVVSGDSVYGQNPPGWGALETQMNGTCNTNDVLRSSADAWHDSGYGSAFTIEKAGASDPLTLAQTGPKARGFWNLPICVPPSSYVSDLNSLYDFLDAPGDWFNNAAPQRSSWCGCWGTTDGNGNTFQDQFPDDWSDKMWHPCATPNVVEHHE